MLKITQVKSRINRKKDHKATLNALGISRFGQTVYHEDTPPIRGMVHKLEYMLKVEVVDVKEKAVSQAASRSLLVALMPKKVESAADCQARSRGDGSCAELCQAEGDGRDGC